MAPLSAARRGDGRGRRGSEDRAGGRGVEVEEEKKARRGEEEKGIRRADSYRCKLRKRERERRGRKIFKYWLVIPTGIKDTIFSPG